VKAARDLPPDEQERFIQRAMKRCSRQKWLVKYQQDKADAVVPSPSALCANVHKGADVPAVKYWQRIAVKLESVSGSSQSRQDIGGGCLALR
jgi:hypothetical protein